LLVNDNNEENDENDILLILKVMEEIMMKMNSSSDYDIINVNDIIIVCWYWW